MGNYTALQGSNWDTDANWTSLTTPTAGDDAHIPNQLNAAVTGGLDQGDRDPDLIRIHEGYRHDIGSSGSPLLITCGSLEHFGEGGLYYSSDDNAGAKKTDDVLIQCANSNVITELGCPGGDDGDYDRIRVNRGTVRLLGSIQFGASCILYVGHLGNRLGDAKVNLASGADTLPTLILGGGTMVSHGAITTAYAAGDLTQDVAAITTLHVATGGTVTYNHTGTITTATIWPGGTLNLLGNAKVKTITTINAMPMSTFHYDANLLSYTTFNDWRRDYP